MDLVVEIYHVTQQFPKEELYAYRRISGERRFLSHRTSQKALQIAPRSSFLTSFRTRSAR